MFSSNQHPPSPSDAASPLLSNSIADNLLRSRRLIRQPPRPLRGAARFLRRASGRRLRLREPSVRVRESAAEQLEERQSDWAYSRPVVVLDLLWNAVLLGIGLAVLWFSYQENPSVPLRMWIGGYVLQCAVHMFCVGVECTRRRRVGEVGQVAVAVDEASPQWESSSGSGSDDSEDYGMEQSMEYTATRLNLFSFLGNFKLWFLKIFWGLNCY